MARKRDPFFVRAADWSGNALLRAYNAVLGLLPYEKRIASGGAIGRGVLSRLPEARKRAFRNLDLVRPDLDEAGRRALLRDTSDNFGRLLVEQMNMADFIADPSRFHPSGPGWETVKARIEAGGSVILAAAHYGNWEALRAVPRFMGHGVAGIYRPHNNPYYNADFVRGVHVMNPGAFPKGKQGTREMLRHMRGGGSLLILVDQKQTGSPMIDFLGAPGETTLTAAKLAVAYDAMLVPAIGRRRADGVSFDALFGEPVAQGDPLDMMTEVNAKLGELIAEEPSQWFWFHRRWR